MDEAIRAIVGAQGALTTPITGVAGDADLYALGLTSHAAVRVMLGLEDRFGIEFPDSLITRETFGSLDSLAAAVRELTGPA